MRRLLSAAALAATLCAALASLHGVRAQERPDDLGYARTPAHLRPFAGSGEPARWFFQAPMEFRGPGREAAAPKDVDIVRIGVLAPLQESDGSRGKRMLRGVGLAVEEANAAGGYAEGVPFETVVRAENEAWGAAANAAVELVYDHGVVGLVGGLEDEASHVLSRVLLKIEVPTVNTGGADPTLTEHAIPWLVRVRPDDRQACYRLATRIFEEDGRRRVAVFRANSRYARVGIKEFVDAARRLHHPILLETRFESHETSWEAPLARIRAARADAILLWGEGASAARALKALRAAGLDQPVYGPERLAEREFLDAVGDAAEGLVFAYPFDPAIAGDPWKQFVARYTARFGEAPDAVAAHAYDGTRRLIEAIRGAGQNRPLIRDWLFARPQWSGVTGRIRLDVTGNDVREAILGSIRDGRPSFER